MSGSTSAKSSLTGRLLSGSTLTAEGEHPPELVRAGKPPAANAAPKGARAKGQDPRAASAKGMCPKVSGKLACHRVPSKQPPKQASTPAAQPAAKQPPASQFRARLALPPEADTFVAAIFDRQQPVPCFEHLFGQCKNSSSQCFFRHDQFATVAARNRAQAVLGKAFCNNPVRSDLLRYCLAESTGMHLPYHDPEDVTTWKSVAFDTATLLGQALVKLLHVAMTRMDHVVTQHERAVHGLYHRSFSAAKQASGGKENLQHMLLCSELSCDFACLTMAPTLYRDHVASAHAGNRQLVVSTPSENDPTPRSFPHDYGHCTLAGLLVALTTAYPFSAFDSRPEDRSTKGLARSAVYAYMTGQRYLRFLQRDGRVFDGGTGPGRTAATLCSVMPRSLSRGTDVFRYLLDLFPFLRGLVPETKREACSCYATDADDTSLAPAAALPGGRYEAVRVAPETTNINALPTAVESECPKCKKNYRSELLIGTTPSLVFFHNISFTPPDPASREPTFTGIHGGTVRVLAMLYTHGGHLIPFLPNQAGEHTEPVPPTAKLAAAIICRATDPKGRTPMGGVVYGTLTEIGDLEPAPAVMPVEVSRSTLYMNFQARARGARYLAIDAPGQSPQSAAVDAAELARLREGVRIAELERQKMAGIIAELEGKIRQDKVSEDEVQRLQATVASTKAAHDAQKKRAGEASAALADNVRMLHVREQEKADAEAIADKERASAGAAADESATLQGKLAKAVATHGEALQAASGNTAAITASAQAHIDTLDASVGDLQRRLAASEQAQQYHGDQFGEAQKRIMHSENMLTHLKTANESLSSQAHKCSYEARVAAKQAEESEHRLARMRAQMEQALQEATTTQAELMKLSAALGFDTEP